MMIAVLQSACSHVQHEALCVMTESGQLVGTFGQEVVLFQNVE